MWNISTLRLNDRHRRRYGFVGLALLLLIGLLTFVSRSPSEQELYVGFFGRVKDSPYARIHRHALTHYMDLLSEDTPGYRFVLRPFYLDQNDALGKDEPSKLKWMYETIIASDERYVMVIDNTWAKHVQAVGSVVRERKIPMLSLNADKGPTNFGGYGIFMGHSDLAPGDLVTYMNEVIQPATVGFVGEEDYWLTKEFLNLTKGPGDDPHGPTLQLDFQNLVATAETTDLEKGQLQEQLKAWFDDAPQPAVLLLNVHNDWGHEIIDYVDENLKNVTILAASYAAREGKSSAFPRGDGGNHLILMTEPEDAVSKQVFHDAAMFRKAEPEDFEKRFNIPFYVKRCSDAAEIMRQALLQEKQDKGSERLSVNRNLFGEYFRNHLTGKSVLGRYDLYSFDDEGRSIPEISFVEYHEGVATSQWSQLNSRREIIPTVFFGIDLLDIGRLDPVNGRFRADFYYWVRVQSVDEIPSISEIDPMSESSSNEGQPEIAGRPVSDYVHFRNLSRENIRTLIEGAKEGNYRLERISGEFNVDFQLDNYPLDTQELTLELELANPFDDVRVAFDYAEFQRSRRNLDMFDIPGWEVVDYYVTVDNVISQALRGATPGELREPRKYKTLTVRIVTQRKIQSALISVALPLCTIGIAALSLLFIRDIRFNRVGDVYIGVFLSIITYSIAFSQLTPSTGVITRADYLFYLTFLAVLLVFLRFVVLNVLGLVEQDDETPGSPRLKLGFSAVAFYMGAMLVVIFI